jgi:DNA-binding transcriptional ArsR family regulator
VYDDHVEAFDVLGDPIRRRILDLLAGGEQTAGAVTETVRREFGVTQPAVSRHLRVLRDAGFVDVRPDGASRWYRLRGEPFLQVDIWLERYRSLWIHRIDALETELARGRRTRPEEPR